MGALADNRFIFSLAKWAWESDPSPLVSPTSCLDSLPLLSAPCLTRLVAKGVGIGIIICSCINKAPVIRNILASRSVAGLSITACYGEVIMYSNAAFYNILRGNPFTAYGETFMVKLQALIVVALIWSYEPKIGRSNIALAILGYCAYLFVVFQGTRSISISSRLMFRHTGHAYITFFQFVHTSTSFISLSQLTLHIKPPPFFS